MVRIAKENRSWGYDRIADALANLGHDLSDETVGNILRRHGIPPAPERKQGTTWKEFIASHREVHVVDVVGRSLAVRIWFPNPTACAGGLQRMLSA